jgi:hypothetical protein
MNSKTPEYTRREFLSTAAASAAISLVPAAARAAAAPTKPDRMIGIQVGAASFLDEGTERVLDIVQERGAVNTLFLASFTYGQGIAGRQVQGQPLPDHGRQEYDREFHGGNYATPHAKYYAGTSLKQTKAPDHGEYDLLAEVVPKAQRRGLKVYAWYEDHFRADTPGIEDLIEVDWQGRRVRPTYPRATPLCPLHPDYRAFITGLTQDYCENYALDGVMWGSERQGPLHNAFSARADGTGDSSRVSCFCEHHQKAARERGIDVARAKEGFRQLDRFLRAARAHERPADGYFVEFWRLLLACPELLAWEKLWTDGKHAIYGDVFQAAKASRPSVQVGFHIWHLNSFSPFFRAEQNYAELAKTADFLKIVVYNNCGGPRYAGYLDNVSSTLFGDVPKDDLLRLYNTWLGFGAEAPLDQLPSAGLSSDYVFRESRRAIAGVAGTRCKIYPGLDIDIPTAKGERRTAPKDVQASTTAALESGANGVIFSRKYSEMNLANLAAGGRAVKDFQRKS